MTRETRGGGAAAPDNTLGTAQLNVRNLQNGSSDRVTAPRRNRESLLIGTACIIIIERKSNGDPVRELEAGTSLNPAPELPIAP
jgi:hypothetical protein